MFWVSLILGAIFIELFLFKRRERRDTKHETWWANYRERERIKQLQRCWRAKFRRLDDETEDEFLARFERYLTAYDRLDDREQGSP